MSKTLLLALMLSSVAQASAHKSPHASQPPVQVQSTSGSLLIVMPVVSVTPVVVGPSASSLICGLIRNAAEAGDRSIAFSSDAVASTYSSNGIDCTFKSTSDDVVCTVPAVRTKAADRMVGTLLRDGVFAGFDLVPVEAASVDNSTVYAIDNVTCVFNNSTDAVSCDFKSAK